MTIFENFINRDIDKFVDYLDEHFTFDDAPWWKWWDKNYCNKCEAVIEFNDHSQCGYCEVYGNCRFFKDMKEIPDSKQIIKMWLESESEDSAHICTEEDDCSTCEYCYWDGVYNECSVDGRKPIKC